MGDDDGGVEEESVSIGWYRLHKDRIYQEKAHRASERHQRQ